MPKASGSAAERAATLLDALDEAVRHKDELLEQATLAVASWSWRPSPSGVEHEELFWAERNGLRSAPEEAGSPPTGAAADRIGRDPDGRFVLAHLSDRRGDPAGRCIALEETGSTRTSVVVGSGRKELAIGHRHGGRLVRHERVRRRSRLQAEYSVESYGWDDGHAVRIERHHLRCIDADWSPASIRVFELAYLASGDLASISEVGVGPIDEAES